MTNLFDSTTLPPEPLPPPGEAARALHLPGRIRDAVAEFDRRADKALDRWRGNPVADRVMYTATELGDFALIWHMLATARGLRSDRHAAEAVRASVILGVESALVNGVIKSFFRRTRPEWNQARAYRIRRPRSSSFPSGHASSAFTAAGVLAQGSPAAPLWYGLAAVVATSRSYVRIHHASDVVGGAVTGIALGRIARRVWPRPVDGNPFSGMTAGARRRNHRRD
jgi:membrane-associated phospholipid phosphatase